MGYLDKIKLANYTRSEDWLNSISHMVGGGLSVIALILCLVRAIVVRRWDYALLGLVYGLTMIAMYSCSSVYHALRPNRGKKAMRMVDHAMIYPMIAGTISPVAVLVIVPVHPALGWAVFGVAWAVVAAAVPITLTLFNKTKVTQMILYLALGWMIIVALRVLLQTFDRTGTLLLVAGGVAYTLNHLRHRLEAPLFPQRFPFLCAGRVDTPFLRAISFRVCQIKPKSPLFLSENRGLCFFRQNVLYCPRCRKPDEQELFYAKENLVAKRSLACCGAFAGTYHCAFRLRRGKRRANV